MSRKTLFADVLLPLAVPNLYTYRIPYELNDAAMQGVRALVPFGKNKFYTALIKNVHENPPQGYQAKYVEDILDPQPIVNETQFTFWNWMSAYYLCNTGEVMNAALPSGLKLSSETKLVANPEIDFEKEDIKDLSDNEYILLEAIQKRNILSFTEAAEVLSVKNPQGTIKNLLAKKYVLLYEEVKERYKPKIIAYVKLNEIYQNDETALKDLFASLETKAFKQLEVLLFYLKEIKKDAVVENVWLKRQHILKHFDGAIINALIKKNVFIQEDFETGRFENDSTTQLQKDLSPLQNKALQQIEESFKTHQTCLLHGITGSGKTEIYCSLIEKTIAEGKQVLYLLPEIALTTQLVTRIKRYFGDKAGVYHSRFSENERVEIWNSVLQQEQKNISFNKQNHQIILGARSALFLPFNNIGLIIIDEEHDSSYKQQDPAPRYHARDAALYLASLHKAKVLLGTATPSIESYYNASQNKYGLVELNERFGGSSLPVIDVIDVRVDGKKTDEVISTPLFEEMKLALSKKEQII
ncbi:MAG TPA: primosomal protein N', partial [Bacteroidia bacterium]|nr:primosomal protein N' [Bacteroidia bacterium]